MVMQKLNTGVTSQVTKGLLGLVLLSAVLGLVLTDAGGFFRSGVGHSDAYRVGHQSVSANQFQKVYRTRLEQSGLTEDVARKVGAPNMILQQEVDREVMKQASQKSGIRISDTYVANQLKQQLDHVPMAGTPAEKLQRVLMQQRITEKELVEALRGDFAVNLLASSITTNDLNIPEGIINAGFQSAKQKRSAEIISLPASALKDKKPLTDKQVQDYFSENKEQYRTAESRDIQALVLPQKLFLKDVAISPEESHAYYEEHKNQFMSTERVQLAQIITQDEASAKKIADAKPADLEALKSDKAQFIKSDWYTKDGLPGELGKALYPSQPKGVIGPVQTSLGWHVMKVEAYQDAQPMPYEQAQEDIDRQLKDEKLDAQMTDFTTELDNMVANASSLKVVADKYKLQVMNVSGLRSDNVKEKFKDLKLSDAVAQRIEEAAMTVENEEISPLMDTSDGDYALVQLTKLTPAAIPDFKTVQDKVRQDAEKSATSKMLVDQAEKLLAANNAKKPEAFGDAVKKAGLSSEAVNGLTREDAAQHYSKEVSQLLFGLTPASPVAYIQGDNKITLVRLKDIVASNEKPSAEQSKAMQDTLRTTMAQELQQQFMLGWQNEIGVSINNAMLNSMFNPQEQE